MQLLAAGKLLRRSASFHLTMLIFAQINGGKEAHEYYWGPFRYGYAIDHDWDARPTEHIALFLCLCISGLFILHLWRANPGESAATKIFWTIILLIPLIGWLAYMNFGPIPLARKSK
jgi:hypothetical protein